MPKQKLVIAEKPSVGMAIAKALDPVTKAPMVDQSGNVIIEESSILQSGYHFALLAGFLPPSPRRGTLSFQRPRATAFKMSERYGTLETWN